MPIHCCRCSSRWPSITAFPYVRAPQTKSPNDIAPRTGKDCGTPRFSSIVENIRSLLRPSAVGSADANTVSEIIWNRVMPACSAELWMSCTHSSTRVASSRGAKFSTIRENPKRSPMKKYPYSAILLFLATLTAPPRAGATRAAAGGVTEGGVGSDGCIGSLLS